LILLLEQACCLLRNISVQTASLNQRKVVFVGIVPRTIRPAARLANAPYFIFILSDIAYQTNSVVLEESHVYLAKEK
jgi:hypothetical protein